MVVKQLSHRLFFPQSIVSFVCSYTWIHDGCWGQTNRWFSCCYINGLLVIVWGHCYVSFSNRIGGWFVIVEPPFPISIITPVTHVLFFGIGLLFLCVLCQRWKRDFYFIHSLKIIVGCWDLLFCFLPKIVEKFPKFSGVEKYHIIHFAFKICIILGKICSFLGKTCRNLHFLGLFFSHCHHYPVCCDYNHHECV